MSNNTSNLAIKAENLCKRYFIRHEKKESYETFQDVLIDGGRKIITSLNPFDRRSTLKDETTEEFWALKDIGSGINRAIRLASLVIIVQANLHYQKWNFNT